MPRDMHAAQLYSLAETPQPPIPPHLDSYKSGRYWSVKIMASLCKNPLAVLIIPHAFYEGWRALRQDIRGSVQPHREEVLRLRQADREGAQLHS